MKRSALILGVVVLLLSVGCQTAPDPGSFLIDAPLGSGGANSDDLSHGVYISSYPGTSLESVTMWFSSQVGGDFTVRLTIRDGAFDGKVLAVAEQTGSLETDYYAATMFTFEFGDVAIAKGSLVVLDLEYVDGPAPDHMFYFSIAADKPSPLVVETADKTSLDDYEGAVAIQVAGSR